MSVKQLTEHHLEFLSLKGGYTGLSESTLVKMLHCWKSRRCSNIFKLTFKMSILALTDNNFVISSFTIREYNNKCSTEVFSLIIV